MTLPAPKEGIIPGAASMRLARFTGDRIARQAIMYGRRLDCDSPEGRLICNEIVQPDQWMQRFPSARWVHERGRRERRH
jgi:thioesterase DpgC